MKLYYSPGACSLACHISLEESGLSYSAEKVNLKDKTYEAGNFFKVNPKGQVPTFQLDNGEILTEGAVIMQYIADQKPEARLIPAIGTMERYRAQEWLNYVATEIHKGFSPLFGADRMVANAEGVGQLKHSLKEGLFRRFEYLNEHLSTKPFLMGEQFTVADAYLFTILGWTKFFSIDLGKWPALAAYTDKISLRPAVQKALKAEGLLK